MNFVWMCALFWSKVRQNFSWSFIKFCSVIYTTWHLNFSFFASCFCLFHFYIYVQGHGHADCENIHKMHFRVYYHLEKNSTPQYQTKCKKWQHVNILSYKVFFMWCHSSHVCVPMQTFSLVLVENHAHWSREWKHSILYNMFIFWLTTLQLGCSC